jgi:hypothetical protein
MAFFSRHILEHPLRNPRDNLIFPNPSYVRTQALSRCNPGFPLQTIPFESMFIHGGDTYLRIADDVLIRRTMIKVKEIQLAVWPYLNDPLA